MVFRLDKGLPDRAEGHMDLAVERGMNVQDGYSRLARQFAADGKHGDAFRANLKAMAHGDGLVKPASDAWQNLLKCFLDR